MTTEQLSKQRGIFLADMINFYGADPVGRRSMDGLACVYRSPNGNKCQIGRYLPDERYSKELEGAITDKLMSLLPVEIQALGMFFLELSQDIHDCSKNWADKGITEHGMGRINEIVTDLSVTMPPLINGRYVIEEVGNPPSYIEDFITALEMCNVNY